jgi:hypothetical protein
MVMVSPAGLQDAGDLSLERHLTETYAAEVVAPEVSPWTAADRATVIGPGFELGLAGSFDDHGSLGHFLLLINYFKRNALF